MSENPGIYGMKDIPTIEVKSSQIKAIGYDEDTKTLRVVFAPEKDGACSRYDYNHVPAQVFADMQAAESVGKFFGANVKNAGFTWAKLPDLLPEDIADAQVVKERLEGFDIAKDSIPLDEMKAKLEKAHG